MASEIVDVFVAIGVPFTRSGGVRYVDRMRFQEAGRVSHAVRQHGLGAGVQRLRAGRLFRIRLEDLRSDGRSGLCSHANNPSAARPALSYSYAGTTWTDTLMTCSPPPKTTPLTGDTSE